MVLGSHHCCCCAPQKLVEMSERERREWIMCRDEELLLAVFNDDVAALERLLGSGAALKTECLVRRAP